LTARVDQARPFGRYHEPFLGGGALFFEMVRTQRLSPKRAYLSDNNARLIEAYEGVKQNVDRVIARLREHAKHHSEEHYYAVRARLPDDFYERAARIIYLNKTGFNGLYRENSRGGFNVPFGRYKNPLICDEPNLRATATALRHARIEARHFERVLDHAEPGDLVYFDPPYNPLSKTASFTSYEKSGFGEDSQRLLAHVAEELGRRNVKVLLSNSMTPLVRELYEKAFAVEEVFATRNINSRADRRGPIAEALICNF
jgi:DNA adenine methylase